MWCFFSFCMGLLLQSIIEKPTNLNDLDCDSSTVSRPRWWSPPPVSGKACDASQEDQVVALSRRDGLHGLGCWEKNMVAAPRLDGPLSCISMMWLAIVVGKPCGNIKKKWVVWGLRMGMRCIDLGWLLALVPSAAVVPSLCRTVIFRACNVESPWVNGDGAKLLSSRWSCLRSDPFWSSVPKCDPQAISLFPQSWEPKQSIMRNTHVCTWPWLVAWASQGIRTTSYNHSSYYPWFGSDHESEAGHNVQPRLQKLREPWWIGGWW